MVTVELNKFNFFKWIHYFKIEIIYWSVQYFLYIYFLDIIISSCQCKRKSILKFKIQNIKKQSNKTIRSNLYILSYGTFHYLSFFYKIVIHEDKLKIYFKLESKTNLFYIFQKNWFRKNKQTVQLPYCTYLMFRDYNDCRII